jgi:hypothetical protein
MNTKSDERTPSLLDLLPRIATEGKREAEQILDRLSGPNHLGLQTSEYIIPAKAQRQSALLPKNRESGVANWESSRQSDKSSKQKSIPDSLLPIPAPWLNRLLYGDNLLVMQALLTGESRGMVKRAPGGGQEEGLSSVR